MIYAADAVAACLVTIAISGVVAAPLLTMLAMVAGAFAWGLRRSARRQLTILNDWNALPAEVRGVHRVSKFPNDSSVEVDFRVTMGDRHRDLRLPMNGPGPAIGHCGQMFFHPDNPDIRIWESSLNLVEVSSPKNRKSWT